MKPNIRAYDWILINSSGGKDSQAQLTYLVELADKAGIPRNIPHTRGDVPRLIVVHADLGIAEWEGTRELAERQAMHYGLRFVVVKNETKGTLLDYIRDRGKFPDAARRFCTSDLKRAPIQRVMTMLAKESRAAGAQHSIKILNCMGIRAAESRSRAKQEPLVVCSNFIKAKKRKDGTWLNSGYYDLKTGSLMTPTGRYAAKTVDRWYPIFDWSEEDVWRTIKLSGVEHHKAYDLGMPRLSCCFCVFAPKQALMIAGKHNPELLKQYVDLEEEIGHSFRHKFKIKEIQDALAEGKGADLDTLKEEAKSWNM